MTSFDRRRFLSATSAGFVALAGSGCMTRPPTSAAPAGYGPLVPDPAALLDLPVGFAYRVLSSLGEAMSDGGRVPDAADGMGCFALPGGKLALVRNHELRVGKDSGEATGLAYDSSAAGAILPGGTTTLVLDARTLTLERQFRTLSGTIRNCAGGITPWGSWLTCEEDTTRAGASVGRDHGWVFEVPAAATGPVDPVPLTAMGRFNHEAACVDPASGIVYLTEDREDSLLYRFLPAQPGRLAAGGKLQAWACDGLPDSRNWSGAALASGAWTGGRWVDLDRPESPADDLRKRGAALGATLFARGEGIWMGAGELYFACTSGGAARLGQIFRLRPGRTDRLQLFYESTDIGQFNYGDNLLVAPDGQLVVCEDAYSATVDNHLRGITRDGRAYPLARVRIQTEPAGACFSPDGRVLFVNLYSPAKTLAISGPWVHLPG
ncbi:MAG: alkaline phosphatase PhoX [Novosphingobium sp.]